MTQRTTAVYANGVLTPAEKLDVPEGATVRVSVDPSPCKPPTEAELDDFTRRLDAAKTPEEFFAVAAEAGDDDPAGEDFFEAMNANRSPGERKPYPPEMKGKSW